MADMLLSAPVERTHVHTRQVECRGYHRADGLWDIEGRVTDTKTYAFENEWRGTVEPGDPVHDMLVRITVDDGLTIHAAEAVTLSSPFRICPEAAPNFARLAGLRIGPGWMRQVKERYGGAQGCTHVLELLNPLATTAYQTIYSYRERLRGATNLGEELPERRGPKVNSCYAYGSDREVIRRFWPEYYTGDA